MIEYVGDLNHDGSVDGNDVSILLEQVLGGGASPESDLNDDGSVDGNDVSILLETVLGGDPKEKNPAISYQVNGVKFYMVEVPAGTYTMGATAEQGNDAYNDELPTHEVTLSSFQIGQTEVTQALWKAVMDSNPSYNKGDNLPVECVSLDACQKFIAKLNQLTGLTFRLPTEAEWEYAARGGHSGGTKYAGSDNADEVAWYEDNSGNATHPVSSKLPNELGIYDMSGNVAEWCSDWYDTYNAQALTNPSGASTGEQRVTRGGFAYEGNRNCRVSFRDVNYPDKTFRYVGLRLVLDPHAKTYTVNGVPFTLREVPGGTFTMGGTAEQGSGAEPDELPTHEVTLSPFWIGQTEVTQALWKAVMGSNPSNNKGDDLPVEYVSWDDCQEFIAKLNTLTGLSFRLPTEAEWEYAARGGQSGGYKYSGSNVCANVAWYGDNSDHTTHPVATKSPNGLFIYDMSGNVAEWCQDRYEEYSPEAQTDPTGPETGFYRVCRGGGYYSTNAVCRVSNRNYREDGAKNKEMGLRLVLDLPLTYTVNGVDFTMLKVQGGTFTMGATAEQGEDAYNDELPTHEVTLSPFWIGQTEVTQALWKAVMGSNPSYNTGDNLPVEYVSWDDCQEFVAKLNEMTGETFRLPTEAEWEYAARGGQSGGTKYAGSNDADAVAWYNSNSPYSTHAVASKLPNALCLYDMSGNVWEWCQDYYGEYTSEAVVNPTGASIPLGCVFRGGSYNGISANCRVSRRGHNAQSLCDRALGLRLAR